MTIDWRTRDFLKPGEYAEITEQSKNSVYSQIKSGQIPSIQTGPRSIRIPTSFLKGLEQQAHD